MPADTKVPDQTTMRLWLEQGLTHQQIADRWERETNIHVARSTVTRACIRYGLTTDTMNRYQEYVPWRVRAPHAMAYPLRMLRLMGRKAQKGELSETEEKALASWLEKITTGNMIVAYDPDDPGQGVYYIDAQYKDHDGPAPIRRKTFKTPRRM